jgi:hypothetical protein
MEDPLGLKYNEEAGVVIDDALSILENSGYNNYTDDKITIRFDANDVLTIWIDMVDGYDHLVFETHFAEIKSLDITISVSTVFRKGLWMDYLANLRDSIENDVEEIIETDEDNFSPINDSEVFKNKGEK